MFLLNVWIGENTKLVHQANFRFDLPELPLRTAIGDDRNLQTICQTMQDKCPRIWTLNGYADTVSDPTSGMEQCMGDLRSLPIMHAEQTSAGGLNGTGRSQSCRTIHSILAGINEDHCAHISFLPAEDPNGHIKCQEESKPTLDLFTDDDMDLWRAHAVKLGFPSDKFNRQVPLEADGSPPNTSAAPEEEKNTATARITILCLLAAILVAF